MMTSLSVEYLIAIEVKGGFCNSVKSFNNLLSADGDIKIKGNTLTYKELTVGYEVRTDELPEKAQRYFYIKLDCDDSNQVEDFANLLRAVRGMANKAGGHFAVVWDDIGFYYATLAYPKINEIENLLRKLIARFMYTSVGMEWGDTTLPDDLRDSIKRNKRNRQQGANILHETDFIQLADYLFKPYRSPTNGNELIQDRILQANSPADIDIEELKSYLPKSNWTRYFANIVNCNDSFLDKRWQKLYALRNVVAHNSMLTKSDYDEILLLISEVEQPIKEAIESLDKLNIPEDEKVTIAENFASNRGPLYGEFVLLWKQVEAELNRIQNSTLNQSQPKRYRSPLSAIEELRKAQLIDISLFEDLNHLRKIRNMLVHHSDSAISEDLLVKAILDAEIILEWLKNISPPNKAST